MKKICLLLFVILATTAQFPSLTPYVPFQYFGFESRIEANGIVVVYGPAYKTSLRLDWDKVHNGDSSVVGFVLGQHGPYNCNDTGFYTIPPDTTHFTCERHRAYTIQRFRGHKVEPTADTTRYTGVLLKTPFLTTFWYRYQNLVLHSHPGAPAGKTGNDWESPATWVTDTADNNLDPVTIVRDSAGYIAWEHVPTVDSSTTLYQLNRFNDPTGVARIRPGEWAQLICYLDNDSANGYAAVWVRNPRGTFLHSTARVHGRNGTLAQFHAGLYASSAVTSGSVWNDDLFIMHVPDTNYVKHYYIDPGR